MRKIITTTWVTLDGFIAGPNNEMDFVGEVIYRSASIVQELTNYSLIDEYQVLVHPFILGSGKPLFKNIKERASLKLVHTEARPSGVVVLTYQPK